MLTPDSSRSSSDAGSCLSDDRLRSLLAGTLPDHREAESHLETCEGCRNRLEAIAGGKESEKWLRKFDSWSEQNRKVTAVLAPIRATGMPDHTAPVSRTELTALLNHPASEDALSELPEILGNLDHLQVLEVIGEGGMGVVLRARDPDLDREVAIKMLKPSLASYPELASQFFEEARAIAAISHENIVPIYQVAKANGVPYLVMPLARNQTLEDKLKAEGQLPFETALELAIRITRALSAAHAAGILHRDVKPDNVLIQARKGNPLATVWLADFGLARRETLDEKPIPDPLSINTAGTPGYRAPEIEDGEEADARSDLYGLGTLFEEMVDLSQAPSWFRDLVRRMRSEAPGHRPDSAAEVLDELRKHEHDRVVAHWGRQFCRRCRRVLGRAAMWILPLLLVIGAIDVGMGSSLTNRSLSLLGLGGIQIQGRFGVYRDLGDATSKAASGETITVWGPGYYSTDGCEIAGKELTIRGISDTEEPEIHLTPEALPDRPLIAIREGSRVSLEGLSLVHEPSDARASGALPPLLEITDSSLEAFDCEIRRLKVRSEEHPSTIIATRALKLSLEQCWLHQNRSVLIEWEGRNQQPGTLAEIEMKDCLVSCDRLLRTGKPIDANGALDFRGEGLKANLNQFASFRDGADTLFLRLHLFDSFVQTRTAFLAPENQSKPSRWVPRYIHFNFVNSQLAHLGTPKGMPGKDLPEPKGPTPMVEWDSAPLFIEQTWKLIE